MVSGSWPFFCCINVDASLISMKNCGSRIVTNTRSLFSVVARCLNTHKGLTVMLCSLYMKQTEIVDKELSQTQ